VEESNSFNGCDSLPLSPPLSSLMEAFPQNPVYAVSTSIPHFAAIEYPGPVKSIPRALKTLGGLSHVSSVFANPSDPDASHSIELNLNTRNPFSHPVPGLISQTGNVVLKVVKRKRKKPNLGEDGKVKEGVFTMEVAGIASQTVRFRGAIVGGEEAGMRADRCLLFGFHSLSKGWPISK
jgi:hypothetical protein